MSDIELLNPLDFEWFCKFLLDESEYNSVLVTKKHGDRKADGGIDLTMRRDDKKIYVQCKRWSFGFGANNALPVRVIRELGGCMLRDNIDTGMVITTLVTDSYGQREAERMNITLLGRDEILQRMKELNPEFNIVKRFGLFGKIRKLIWELFLLTILILLLFVGLGFAMYLVTG